MATKRNLLGSFLGAARARGAGGRGVKVELNSDGGGAPAMRVRQVAFIFIGAITSKSKFSCFGIQSFADAWFGEPLCSNHDGWPR